MEYFKYVYQSREFRDAWWFALSVCGALVVSHICMVSYIAYHDLKGHWDRYSLKYQRNTISTYLRHAPSFFSDVTFLLLPSLSIYAYFYHKETFDPVFKHDYSAVHNAVRVVALCIGMCVNNIINRMWAMFVHWVMHESPLLYRHFHKKHHCSIRDFCAASAWQDTVVEFILMEVLGVFIFANLFNPMPWQFNVALAVYNGVGGAIDHSGFYIPGTWIDGRYHWDHHVLVNVNFSEMKMLDSVFGTLKIWHVEPEYLKAPRLNKHVAVESEDEKEHDPYLKLWQRLASLSHLMDFNFFNSSISVSSKDH